MNKLCDYDEGYYRPEAYEIGWCFKCKCNPNCYYKKKAEKDMKRIRKNNVKRIRSM